jgi:prepilin-type N-terminal cleavage/methylation domain-containing protein
MTQKRAGEDAGFTLIEIMVAVVVFAFSVAGLMTLLTASMRANASAIDGTNAIGIADSYVETVRTAALAWTGDRPLADEAPVLNVAPGTWTIPVAPSAWSDELPHDPEGRVAGAANARKAIFCVHYRTRWGGSMAGSSDEVELLVRVSYSADGDESWESCDPAFVEEQLGAGGTARAIILPTVLRKNPLS